MKEKINKSLRSLLVFSFTIAFVVINFPAFTVNASSTKIYDNTAPLVHVLVNGWWNRTMSKDVQLEIAAADNYSQPERLMMRVSNKPDFSDATLEPFSELKEWTLDVVTDVPEETEVYVQIIDPSKNASTYILKVGYSPFGFGCGGAYTTKPVYRFWSDNYRSHFYTMDATERNDIIAKDPNWKYEGEAFKVYEGLCDGVSPVFRFWSEEYRSHFYTTDRMEWLKVRAQNPENIWKYENMAYWTVNSYDSGAKGLYRFWSDNYRSHFYTSDPVEKDKLIKNNPNWKYEWVAYYVK